MATIEIGEKIKEVFDNRHMKLTDFADELGTVRQNVYRIFKKRHVDTGLLLKISQVLDHNFFQYYVSSPIQEEGEAIKQLKTETSDFQKQLELSRKEIDYLRRIIKLMEEKAELVQQLGKDSMMLQ
ncbi:helix-turn-helix domain-containing protein [Chryseolinea soli]|uniref:helix-turn-helix domain-containing protein n=1 Tax=Chryseolinea soli TaxID=2321403 RepID=UPI00162ADD67|nr:helix-turn-helix transcriptional regulator [Chryseolinea soli]